MRIEKGKKGFQNIPKEQLKNKRLSAYFTQIESEKIFNFVKENNINLTQLIRSRLKDIIE